MALADDLQEREKQAGNAEDAGNLGQREYDEKFNHIAKAEEDRDFDDIIADNYGDEKGATKNVGGDVVQRNYNAGEPESIKDKEQAGNESLYNQNSKSVPSGFSSWFARKAKRYGASGGILGILGVGMIVISVTLSPAALFAAIEKGLTNDGSDFSRTNSQVWKAYRTTLFNGDCSGSKLKCKFVTMSKKQLLKWTDNRFKVYGTLVDADGKEVPGGEKEVRPDDVKDGQRVKMMSLIFPNGVRVSNNQQFENETDRNIESRRWGLRALNAKSGSFFTAKFNAVLSKFKLSKGTIPDKNAKPPEDEATKRKVITDGKEKADSKLGGMMNKFASKSGFVTGPLSSACTIYNVIRIVTGVVKAKFIFDVVTFAFPFVQIASKLADGSATDKDFKNITERADQLTWYPSAAYSQKLAAQETDAANKQKILSKANLSGTDAQGLRMAMYGDTTGLMDFTKDYTTGGIGSVRTLSEAIDDVNGKFPGGEKGVRSACIGVQQAAVGEGVATAVLCVVGSALTFGAAALVCAAKTVAVAAAVNYVQGKAMDYVIGKLLESLMSADIPSDLRGVDAGNALAAGMGMMLAQTGLGHGMKPAKNVDEVREFITMTDDAYYEDYTEIAMDDAAKNPFDLYNQYSFASMLNSSLNPYISGQKSGFAFMTNFIAVLQNTFVPSASALYSQPSLMTNNEDNLKHRLNVVNGVATCPDADKANIGVVCDWSGRIVGVSSKNLLTWTMQMINGDIKPFNDTLDYMQQTGEFKDVGEKGEADGGTYDETCADTNNIVDAITGTCEDSKLPSIKEDGSPVEKSQYSMYKKYCTNDRELDIGSADETVEMGSDRDQLWITGEQCSVDSEMMDRFAFYYNLCETQYAMANDETDCVKDTTQSLAAVTPSGSGWVVPTSGPCFSAYGMRSGTPHQGIDISPPSGTPIVAPTDMTITYSGYNSGGYGNMVTGKADDGSNYSFRFGHMLNSDTPAVGMKVKKGEQIGLVGSTGDSSGPHLHFEVFPPGADPANFSGAVDPVPIMQQNGVVLVCQANT